MIPHVRRLFCAKLFRLDFSKTPQGDSVSCQRWWHLPLGLLGTISQCGMDAGVCDLRTHRWCAAGITLRYSQITGNMLTPLSSFPALWMYLSRSWHRPDYESWGCFQPSFTKDCASTDVCGRRCTSTLSERTTSPKSARCSAIIFERLKLCRWQILPVFFFLLAFLWQAGPDGCCDEIISSPTRQTLLRRRCTRPPLASAELVEISLSWTDRAHF